MKSFSKVPIVSQNLLYAYVTVNWPHRHATCCAMCDFCLIRITCKILKKIKMKNDVDIAASRKPFTPTPHRCCFSKTPKPPHQSLTNFSTSSTQSMLPPLPLSLLLLQNPEIRPIWISRSSSYYRSGQLRSQWWALDQMHPPYSSLGTPQQQHNNSH